MSYRSANETNTGYFSGGTVGYRAVEPTDTYRGYRYAKDGMFNLHALVCPKGKVLPTSLSQRFTKVAILQAAVDKYLSDNQLPEGSLEDYVAPKPRRQHRRTRPIEPDILDLFNYKELECT
jgi:hypothetical protein